MGAYGARQAAPSAHGQYGQGSQAMNLPNVNRRHGLKNEGVFAGWLRDRGFPVIHLSPSHSAGDVVAWIGDRCCIFECKRVDLKKKTKVYRLSKNPKQRDALIALKNHLGHRVEIWYAISFIGTDNGTTTRFVPVYEPVKTIGVHDGTSWENMGLESSSYLDEARLGSCPT